MNAQEVLATFKTLGKPQTAAIYKRHGLGDNVFGVLSSEVAKISKRSRSTIPSRWNSGKQETLKPASWLF